MAFCSKERQLAVDGATSIDNKFILNYLPDAPDKRSAVYLFGLALSDNAGADNALDIMAKRLMMTEREILDAYYYWEELGLVHIISSEQPQIIYLSVRNTASALKKIKPSKYSKFTKDIQNVVSGRMITVSEYNEYYMFLENNVFEPEALVAVAKYCVELKGNDINYAYILTVCRNLMSKGFVTAESVTESLSSKQKYDDDLALTFKAANVKRKIEFADRELYEKWVKDMGFTLDVVSAVAKKTKNGGMQKLDAYLSEYYRKGVFSVKEIDAYEKNKTELYELAREINKSIGVYYQSLDMIVDEYLVGWMRKGFDGDTLIAVAKYCFRSGIRTLAGLASVIDKFYKTGITDINGVDRYLSELAGSDEEIKAILEKAGLVRNVNSMDRKLYKIWTEQWNISVELLLYAAQKSAGTANPAAYMNKVLSDYKQNNIKTVNEAENRSACLAAVSSPKNDRADIPKREYTDEQLSALFSALGDGDEK